MKIMKKLIAAAALVTLTLSLLAGCAEKAPAGGDTGDGDEKQTLVMATTAQFPPYALFIRLLFRGAQAAVKKACLDSVATLSAYFANQHMQPLQFDYGSAPIARIKGETRMQILLKLDLPHIQNRQVEKIYRLFDGCVFEDCTMIMETDPPNLL